MSELTPPKHGSGGGSPNIKELHNAFLYMKFVRPTLIITSSCMIISMIIEGIIFQNYVNNPKILGLFPASHDIIFTFFIFAVIVWILGTVYLARLFHKQYKMIRYAHISFCKCDRTRWYNKE